MRAVAEANIEHDYYDWICQQATLLRRHRPAFLDWANLAEELEGMGRSEVNTLESFIERLLMHLLKWTYAPRKRSGSWEASIANSRDRIAKHLRTSPSLKAKLGELFESAYITARRTAGAQMGFDRRKWERALPPACPWSIARVLDPEFWPEAESDNGKH